jgi:hypothetical protein
MARRVRAHEIQKMEAMFTLEDRQALKNLALFLLAWPASQKANLAQGGGKVAQYLSDNVGKFWIVDLLDQQGDKKAKQIAFYDHVPLLSSPAVVGWFHWKLQNWCKQYLRLHPLPEPNRGVVLWVVPENMPHLLSRFHPDQSSALKSYGVLSGQIFGVTTWVAANFLHPGVQFQNPSLRYALASQMDVFTSLQTDPSRFAEVLEHKHASAARNYQDNLNMLLAMGIDLETWKSLKGAQRSVCHQDHTQTIAKVTLVTNNWPWLDTLDKDFADGDPNLSNYRILKCDLTAYSAASLHLAVACCKVEGGILNRPTSTQKPWIQAVFSACNCANPKTEEIEPMTARYRAVISEFGPKFSSGFLQHLSFCVPDDAADVRRVRDFLAEFAPDVRLRFSKVVSGKLLLDCVSTEHGQEKMRVSFNTMGITEENDIPLTLLCGDKFLHRFIVDDAGRGNRWGTLRSRWRISDKC